MIKKLINQIKIHYYTGALMKAFVRYAKIRDEYSCGVNLAEYISPRLREAKEKVNEIIRKIKKLDPAAKLSELD